MQKGLPRFMGHNVADRDLGKQNVVIFNRQSIR